MDEWMHARSPDHFDCIVLHAGFHSSTSDFRTAARNCIRFRQWLNIDEVQPFRIETRVPSGNYLTLMFLCGVIKQYLEEETIELRLRQWISAFIFNRILRCQHGEDHWQGIGIAVDRYLALFHGFEQSRL